MKHRFSRSVALLALALLAPLPAMAAVPDEPAGAPTGRWYAVQLHAHSKYSDGYHAIGDLVRWGKEGGLDALAVTDHNTDAHLKDAVYQKPQGLTLIPGYEWTEGKPGPHEEEPKGPTTERCHISVWGVTPSTPILSGKLSRKQMLAAMASHKEVLLGANHPFDIHFPWPDDDYSGVSTMEVWNWHFGFDEVPAGAEPLPLPTDAHLPHDGLPDKSFLVRNSRALAAWAHAVTPAHHITPVAACDFHIGTPMQSLVSPCTLVWSRSASVNDLLSNLKAGHVCLVENPHAPRVEVWADPKRNGSFSAMAGDTVAAGTHVQFRVTGCKDQTISVYHGSELVERGVVPNDSYEDDLPVSNPGFYWARVDRDRDFNPIISMTGALYVSGDK